MYKYFISMNNHPDNQPNYKLEFCRKTEILKTLLDY